MFYLDPTAGRTRRARTRDRVVGLSHDAGHAVLAQGRRAADHLRGTAARGRSLFADSPTANNWTLRQRIRSRLGRVASRPRSIDVQVDRGFVCLQGRVPADEVGAVMKVVSATPGVDRVDNLLSPIEPTDLHADDQSGGAWRPTALVGLIALAALAGLACTPAGRRLFEDASEYWM
jgi:hypothetical protein